MNKKRTLFVLITVIINIALDQVTKVIVRNTIDKYEQIPVVGDLFILLNVENKGAFLGLGSDLNPVIKLIILQIAPIAVLIYLIYYIISTKELNTAKTLALSSITGGGIANIYDRIVYGSVTDFLFIDLGGIFKTGIFNVADMSVSFGMVVLIYYTLTEKKQ
jgi:signal peptidase II